MRETETARLHAAERAARLARIRDQVRHGVWALRHEAELQAHWEALEREIVAAVQGETGAALQKEAHGSTCSLGF